MKFKGEKGRMGECYVCGRRKYIFKLETDGGETQEWCLHCIEEESDILLRHYPD